MTENDLKLFSDLTCISTCSCFCFDRLILRSFQGAAILQLHCFPHSTKTLKQLPVTSCDLLIPQLMCSHHDLSVGTAGVR